MKRIPFLLAASLAALAMASACRAGPSTLASRVDAALAAAGFQGEVLVADRGQVLLERSTGGAQPGQRWRWASVSKQVAAALTMRQVQAGTLALDDPIARHLPAAAAHPGITVRQLLMHTSGLPNPQVASLPADPLPACLGPASHPPGQRFEYRNCDTLVLAAVLSRVAGKPYPALLRDELTAAIGPHGVALASTPAGLAAFGAAGALTGTARELLALDRALLARQWLDASALATLWTGEPRLGYVALGAWAFPAPLKGCMAPVDLVERRGAINGVQVRNVIAPATGKIVILFTPSDTLEFGEVWQGRGLLHDVLAAALCD